MKIRGRSSWASPPDLQSSTLQPLHHNPSSLLLPNNSSSVSFQQDALTGVEEDEDAALERSTTVATHRRNVSPNPIAETSADSSISSSLSLHGHWLEEDKIFPVKKRRVLMNFIQTHEPSNSSITSTTVERARRKRINKSWSDHYAIEDFEWLAEMEINPAQIRRKTWRSINVNNVSNERCSRGNGKGWRCSRTSHAGSSMCEHHFRMRQRGHKRKNLVLRKLQL